MYIDLPSTVYIPWIPTIKDHIPLSKGYKEGSATRALVYGFGVRGRPKGMEIQRNYLGRVCECLCVFST